VESARITSIPLEMLEEAKLLERKKDTGEISAHEGYQTNAILAYSIGLKIHEEMWDEVKVKKVKDW